MLYPAEFGTDPLFPEKSDFKVIHANEDTGFGVISYRAFKRGDIIAKMSGYVVPEIMQHTLQISATKHNHDPYFSGFFLHSCEQSTVINTSISFLVLLEEMVQRSSDQTTDTVYSLRYRVYGYSLKKISSLFQ